MTAPTAPRSRTTGALRRATVAVAVAGAAALTALVSAPQASAAAAAGPDGFVQLDHGRAPVFFCDPEKPNKQHDKCLDLAAPRVG
jgi:hypothetical protein